jgi:hypothetical protein
MTPPLLTQSELNALDLGYTLPCERAARVALAKRGDVGYNSSCPDVAEGAFCLPHIAQPEKRLLRLDNKANVRVGRFVFQENDR